MLLHVVNIDSAAIKTSCVSAFLSNRRWLDIFELQLFEPLKNLTRLVDSIGFEFDKMLLNIVPAAHCENPALR